jgi:hypothetical protein
MNLNLVSGHTVQIKAEGAQGKKRRKGHGKGERERGLIRPRGEAGIAVKRGHFPIQG